jgi:hypothetical protein
MIFYIWDKNSKKKFYYEFSLIFKISFPLIGREELVGRKYLYYLRYFPKKI